MRVGFIAPGLFSALLGGCVASGTTTSLEGMDDPEGAGPSGASAPAVENGTGLSGSGPLKWQGGPRGELVLPEGVVAGPRLRPDFGVPSGTGVEDLLGSTANGFLPGRRGKGGPRPAKTSGPGAVGPSEGVRPQPGVLTSGVWDDNANFDVFVRFRASLVDKGLAGTMPFSVDTDHEPAMKKFQKLEAHDTLDVALVVDTTGSMGDELAFLKKEFEAMTKVVGERFPKSAQRWSLIAYRDTQDDFLVRWYDFRSSDKLSEIRDALGLLSAKGGGDYPESPERALDILAKLSWRAAGTAKMAFWLADAPHHKDAATAMATAVRDLQGKGVHLYPVAGSGVDNLAELTMRSAAQLTGGRYLFLTDDSGVGQGHSEPRIPCYFVTKLEKSIVRMIDVEMSGKYKEPTPAEILGPVATRGSAQCKAEGGEQFVPF